MIRPGRAGGDRQCGEMQWFRGRSSAGVSSSDHAGNRVLLRPCVISPSKFQIGVEERDGFRMQCSAKVNRLSSAAAVGLCAQLP